MKINSDNVVSLLKLSSLSSYKIAQDTGVSDQTIQNYRDGKTKPRGANLIILSKYLGISDNAVSIKSESVKEHPAVTAKKNEVNESITLYSCPECMNKQKEINMWRAKYYTQCEELNEVNRKYRKLLEGKIEL